MTPKQERFVEHYVASLNATKAAISAGYANRTATSQGSRLLRDPEVKRAIDAATTKRSERLGIKQDSILQELAFIVHATLDMFEVDAEGKVSTRDGVPPGFIGAVAGARMRTTTDFVGRTRERSSSLQLWDKNKALALAMRHLGMLNDKLQIDATEQMRAMIEHEAAEYDAQIRRLASRKLAN